MCDTEDMRKLNDEKDMRKVQAELKKDINRKRACFILGAGFANQISENENTLWKNFLKQGIERCAYFGYPRPNVGWEANMSALLEIGDIFDYLLIAEQLQTRLSKNEIEIWLRCWHDELEVRNKKLIEVVDAIGKHGIPIMTTNYDMLFEKVTGRAAISLDQMFRQQIIDAKDNPNSYVVHLHGIYSMPSSIVLGVRSYDNFLASEMNQLFMKMIPTYCSMVFIGFGQGLDDPNFTALKEWVSKHASISGFRHYHLVRYEDWRTIPADKLIVPTKYGEKYEDLTKYLEALIP